MDVRQTIIYIEILPFNLLTAKIHRGIFILYFQVLDQMEMLSAFTDVLHVANLSTGAHLISILKQVRCHTCHVTCHKCHVRCHM